MGMSDKLRSGRVKVYCPKCEEVYVPMKKFNLDGAFFGPSLPHIFLAFYKTQIILPPKILLYEPRLFGFAISGKRGSNFFIPNKDSVQQTSDKQALLTAALSC
jgi:casein kinase II subunit beta